jgi:hypothetical protein
MIVLWIGGDEQMIELIMFMTDLSKIFQFLNKEMFDKESSTSPEPSAWAYKLYLFS